jgi:3-oxoacyl-[acyl-carrier-protein] synthase II
VSLPRVAVTGIGIVSPLGLNATDHFERLVAGESAIQVLDDEIYKNFPTLTQARVRDFDRRKWVPDRMLRKLLSAGSAYALGSATEALQDSGIAASEFTDCGLYVGSVCLEVSPEIFIPALKESVNKQNQVDITCFAQHGMKLLDPLFLVRSLPNAGLCAIAIQHQILGPNANITNGTISGLQAVIGATEAIRRGDAQVALAGGYDSLVQMDCIVDHLLAGRLARWKGSAAESCRPFDEGRDGYALSEGAAFLMLENLDHACRRKAKIYGEVLFAAEFVSPATFTNRTVDGSDSLSAAAQRALELSSLSANDVTAVFGDGMALEADDTREMLAYNKAIGSAGAPFTAFSGSFGFVGAASGVFSLAHAFLAIHRGVIPPLTNCQTMVAGCTMPCVRSAKTAAVKNAVVWTSDRGIKNAAVVASAC